MPVPCGCIGTREIVKFDHQKVPGELKIDGALGAASLNAAYGSEDVFPNGWLGAWQS